MTLKLQKNIFMKDNKLKKILNTFLNFKINFTLPLKKEIIVYDRISCYLLDNFPQKKINYIVLSTRKEIFNIFALLMMIVKFKISREEYFKSFIYLFRPKIIISASEYDITFYKLKKFFPNIKFFMVQNGARFKNDSSNLQKKKLLNTKLEIDYFFVFSKYYANELKKFIKCNFIVIGSFKCNNVPINKFIIDKRSVIFISTIRKQTKVNNKIIKANSSDKFSNNYWVEKYIVPILFEFCENNNYKFRILLKTSKEKSTEEVKFFLNLVKKNKKCFIYKNFKKSSYEIVDKFENVVFTDSTLGFEAIARGKKVVSIFSRKFDNKLLSNFLWPKFGPKSSNFFTSSNNKSEIIKLFKNNFKISTKHWTNINKNYIRNLIIYQKNNTDFYSLINKILYK